MPPKTAEGIAILATANPTGWHLSHLMALLAFPLFFSGFLVLYKILNAKTSKNLNLLFIIAIGFGFMLFSAAVIIDGLIVPIAAKHYTMMQDNAKTTASFLVTLAHKSALSFFAPGIFFIMVGVALAGFALIKSGAYAKWVGWMGLILGALAIISYIAGIAGTYWDNMRVGGSLVMFTFIWFLVLGVNVWRH